MEAATGFEPVVKVLQTSALPLGYAAIWWRITGLITVIHSIKIFKGDSFKFYYVQMSPSHKAYSRCSMMGGNSLLIHRSLYSLLFLICTNTHIIYNCPATSYSHRGFHPNYHRR